MLTSNDRDIRRYALRKERAAAFRADPDVQAALDASRVAELSTPTLNPGETHTDLLADRTAYENFDPDTAATRGLGAVHLTHLAIEHLLGAC